jgi:chitinase
MRASIVAPAMLVASASARFVMYADEYVFPQQTPRSSLTLFRWHPTRPTNPKDRAGIDHVVIAFAMANSTASFQPKVPISTIRSEYPNAKVMIAVGGWGDDIGFYQASKSAAAIKQFAADVSTMLTNTGADGVGMS